MFPIAVQLYSVRDDAHADFRKTLEQVKAMGYDGVEFAGRLAEYGFTPEEIRDMCKEIGLVPISAHVPYAAMAADPEGVLADYVTVGCKFVGVPASPPDERPGAENFYASFKKIENIGRVAKSLGLQLLYHNHDFEFTKIDGEYGLDILYSNISAEYLQTELDVCWVTVGGEDPVKYIKKYTDRAPIVHLKDFWGEKSDNMYEIIGEEGKAPERPKNFEFRPNGKGVVNFPPILEAAREAGTAWVVVEQDQPSMGLTPMESIKTSIDYLKTINK